MKVFFAILVVALITIPTKEVKALDVLHYDNGKKAIGIPNETVRNMRWVIRKEEKVLQQQRFGIPADFKFHEGQNVVYYFWYWEDVPIIKEAK